jgi:hypothetical protein
MQFEFRPYAHVNGSEGVEANYAEEWSPVVKDAKVLTETRDKGWVSMIVMRHFSGGTWENLKPPAKAVGVSTENRIEHLPNTRQKHPFFSHHARQSLSFCTSVSSSLWLSGAFQHRKRQNKPTVVLSLLSFWNLYIVFRWVGIAQSV